MNRSVAFWFWKKKGADSPRDLRVSNALEQYEKCKKDPNIGARVWVGRDEENALKPFVFCGYADTHSPWFGVAFRINRDCFNGRDAVLYYMMNDRKDDEQRFRDEVKAYSSGLTDIEIVTQYEQNDLKFQGRYNPKDVTMIRFRLDTAKIKESVSVDGGRLIPSAESGGYVLAVPQIGEFDIELGEIIDGKRIPLAYDGFCMK